LVVTGRAYKKIRRGSENGRIFIGDHKNPLAIIRRSEIPEYITDEFNECFTAWQFFNIGMGLPRGGGWMDYPPAFVDTLAAFEGEYRRLTGGK
jgi:hypothetical protein